MKIWVIMGNDFPCGVAGSEEKGQAIIEELREKDNQHYPPSIIYYRLYEYEVQN